MKKKVIFLIIVILLILDICFISYIVMPNKIEKENTSNIQIENHMVYLNSLTLRQKIAQMIIVRGNDVNVELTDLNVGGIFLDRQESEEDYKDLIEKYQKDSDITLFVSTDLEGAWNPFSGFNSFLSFSEVNTSKEAYQIGLRHGELLNDMGFNLNFAPVAEFADESYGGRVFLGSDVEIEEKLEFYIQGLQENVLGTCKHYPGKGMIKNLHYRQDRQEITEKDLILFETCFRNNVSSVMIGHQVVEGVFDSGGKPSSVSREVIDELNDFDGLIISDEVNMRGLKNFYLFNKPKMYKDLINSGENVILDFKLNLGSLYKLVVELEEMVKRGEISEERIDESVKKILKVKRYEVIE